MTFALCQRFSLSECSKSKTYIETGRSIWPGTSAETSRRTKSSVLSQPSVAPPARDTRAQRHHHYHHVRRMILIIIVIPPPMSSQKHKDSFPNRCHLRSNRTERAAQYLIRNVHDHLCHIEICCILKEFPRLALTRCNPVSIEPDAYDSTLGLMCADFWNRYRKRGVTAIQVTMCG